MVDAHDWPHPELGVAPIWRSRPSAFLRQAKDLALLLLAAIGILLLLGLAAAIIFGPRVN